MGYPGIRLDLQEDTIHGFFILFRQSNQSLGFLDEFEGEEFERTPVIVERYDELEVDTYIYTLK